MEVKSTKLVDQKQKLNKPENLNPSMRDNYLKKKQTEKGLK